MQNFQMISSKWRYTRCLIFFRRAIEVLRVSTVKLPVLIDEKEVYETCVFGNFSNEVVATYNSIDEAVQGHMDVCYSYGIKQVAKLKAS